MKYIIDEDKLHTLFMRWKGGRFNMTLNQAEKAGKIGVSQSIISRLESRKKPFSELKSHHFIKMCNEMNIHPVEVLKERGA